MKDFLSGFITFLVAILLIAVFSLILAFPVMWLWNWVMPDLVIINGEPLFQTINFWHALGFNLLCGFLFRGTTSSK